MSLRDVNNRLNERSPSFSLEPYMDRSTSTQSSRFLSSSTDINRHVVPLSLLVPLVGREAIMKDLIAAVERVRLEGAKAEMIRLHGESGSGKSRLVEAMEKQESNQNEFWISAKFGQYKMGSRPFGAMVDAASQICRGIVGHRCEKSIRARVEKRLTPAQLHVLMKIVPSVRMFLPKHRSPQEDVSDGEEGDGVNEHLFITVKSLYRAFLSAVCCHETPCILFLDDVQWADENSLKLILAFAQDDSLRNFLLICAHRDGNEYSFTVPDKTELNLTDVPVPNFDQETVNLYTSNALGLRPEDSKELGQVIFRKTAGNCFFVMNYLEMLHREGLVHFDWANSRFQWDLEQVQARTHITDNVFALVAAKIESMSVDVQNFLAIAACLGNNFKASTLVTIIDLIDEQTSSGSLIENHNDTIATTSTEVSHGQASLHSSSRERVEQALSDAKEEGLIEEVTKTGLYKFSHDKIQQSAFAALPTGKRGDDFLSKLGEALRTMFRSERSQEWMLFTAADLCLKHGNIEVRDLAELCLDAAMMASSKAAFQVASRCASGGADKLAKADGWEKNYELTLELHNIAAETSYANGDIELSREVANNIVNQAKKVEDEFRAYNVLIDTYGSTQEWKLGTEKGVDILKKLGIRIPKRVGKSHILGQALRTKKLLGDRKALDMLNIPTMENPVMEEASLILGAVVQTAFHCGQGDLACYLTFVMMLVTLEHGICTYSPNACVNYGATLSELGDFESAYQFGEVAVRMIENPKMAVTASKVTLIAHGFLIHLKRPIQDSLEPLLNGYKIGMRTGKILDACTNLMIRCNIAFFSGMKISDYETEMKGFVQLHREYNQMGTLFRILPWLQLAENLLGTTKDPVKLTGSAINEDQMLEEYGGSKEHESLLTTLHEPKLVLLYLLGEHELCEDERIKYERTKDKVFKYVLQIYCYFLNGLNCLALAKMGKRPRFFKRLANKYKKELESLVKAGNVNVVPMLTLMSAELLGLKRSQKASKSYETAIAVSSRSGLRLFTGIACECYGQYLISVGNFTSAEEHLQSSYNEFVWLGATAKLDQMNGKYRTVLSFSDAGLRRSSSSSAKFQPFRTSSRKLSSINSFEFEHPVVAKTHQ